MRAKRTWAETVALQTVYRLQVARLSTALSPNVSNFVKWWCRLAVRCYLDYTSLAIAHCCLNAFHNTWDLKTSVVVYKWIFLSFSSFSYHGFQWFSLRCTRKVSSKLSAYCNSKNLLYSSTQLCILTPNADASCQHWSRTMLHKWIDFLVESLLAGFLSSSPVFLSA